MIHPSHISPDKALALYLDGLITVGEDATPVKVYSNWERPTNQLPADFITVYINGDIGGVGMNTDYANGYLMVSLYCKMNDDGSVKTKRVEKILQQLDALFMVLDENGRNRYKPVITEGYFYEYDAQRFITPTTPNQTSGYSITTLNMRWHTTNDFVTT